MSVDIIVLIAAALTAIPAVLFPALGVDIAELSGVYNIGVEGMMLISGAVSFIAALYSKSALAGAIAGMATGMLLGILVALFAVTIRADQILLAIGIILLGLSSSSFLVSQTELVTKVFYVERFKPILFPDSWGFVGVVLTQNALFYLSLIIVPMLWFIVYRTRFGLRVRATGENPRVSDSTGTNVSLIRYICLISSGALASLGGVYLVLGLAGIWVDNITAGRGFIALALVRVGGWKPQWILGASIAYALVEAVQLTLQVIIPTFTYQFLQMFPYLAGILILFASAKFEKWKGPKSMGIPYSREEPV